MSHSSSSYSISDLKLKLTQLSFVITQDNEDEIHTIINALKTPESLVQGNTATQKRIELKFAKQQTIKEILLSINALLKHHFEDKINTFKNENPFYDRITSFWDNKEKYKDEAISHKILSELQNYEAKPAIKEDSFEASIAVFNHLKSQLDAYPDHLFNESERILTPNIQITTLSTVARQKARLIEETYLALGRAMTAYHQSYKRIEEKPYDMLCQAIDKMHKKTIEHRQFCSVFHPQLVPIIITEFDKVTCVQSIILMEEYAHECGTTVKNLSFISTPFAADDVDKEFLNSFSIDHQWMYAKLMLPAPPISKYLTENHHFYSMFNQFDRAVLATLRSKPITTGMPSLKVQQSYIRFRDISGLAGSFFKDSDLVRECNLIHFIRTSIKQLRAFNEADIAPHELLKREQFLKVEEAMIALWRAAHGEALNLPAIVLSHYDNALTPEQKLYYSFVIKQKYLILAYDMVSLLRHNGFTDLIAPQHPQTIHDHLTDEQRVKYAELPGTDGLDDILLEKINGYEIHINQHQMLLIPCLQLLLQPVIFVPDLQAYAEAEMHYQQLIQEQERETRLIEDNIRKNLKAKKDTAKKKKKKQKKYPASVVDTAEAKSEAPALPNKPRTPEAIAYTQAGLLCYDKNVSHQQIIEAYKKVVTPYENDAGDHNEQRDFFHVAASYIEMADCYCRAALDDTHEDFYKKTAGKDALKSVIDMYATAVAYAKNAENCFVKNVTQIEAESEKAYSDLSFSIYNILHKANAKLSDMKNEMQELRLAIQTSQDKLREARQAKIDKIGLTAWRKNPNPKNTFRETSIKNNNEIKHLESAAYQIQNFINQSLAPTTDKFAYLADKGKLPLLKYCKKPADEKQEPTEVLQPSKFSERLATLKISTLLLTTGHSPENVLKLLTTEPQTARTHADASLRNSIEFSK